MKNKYHSLIIGGTGQFGITISRQLNKKKKRVIITSRSIDKKKINKFSTIVKLDIYNKKKILNLIKYYNPKNIFYFAGQSSPRISFVKKLETMKSNYLGCKNVLEVIHKEKISVRFIHAASSEMYGNIKGKISNKTYKLPVNPYGQAKLKAFNLTKFYREKHGVKAYNAIIFNTESLFRKKFFLIPKICLAAINAKRFNIMTKFGNLNIQREWNWCEDQCKILLKVINKKPQDFILSNGKYFSARQMLNFAFEHFNLNYKKFIIENNKKFLRPIDIKAKKSNYLETLKKNNIKKINYVYGKKIITKLIKHYQNVRN